MGAPRVSEKIWDKVRVVIALALIEDGVTSSADVSAYADQLGEVDVTITRAHHELERWYAAGWLVRHRVRGTFYYNLSADGIKREVVNNV